MSGTSREILLIDDDPDMHHAVRAVLDAAGFKVACHTTAPAGLAAIRERRPALLLLDIMLATPTEGYDVARTIRDDPELRDLPIIMLSSVSEDAGAQMAAEAGLAPVQAERFLQKPFDARTLLAAVHATVLSLG